MTDTPYKSGIAIRVAHVARQRETPLAELYRRHLSELTRYIARTFGAGPPDPEDVVQEAFAQFAALENPQAVENPRAFLFAAPTIWSSIIIDVISCAIASRVSRPQPPRWKVRTSGTRSASYLPGRGFRSSKEPFGTWSRGDAPYSS